MTRHHFKGDMSDATSRPNDVHDRDCSATSAGAIPNFFIVGAARSGTTAMFRYLSRHPEVFMSHQKEPAFFGSDLTKTPNEFAVLERQAYLDLFRKSAGFPVRGEGSVLYLFSKKAAQEIHEFNSAARILIILRNPIDMLHSYHGQMHWIGHEDIADFEEAYAAESDRRRGQRVPKNALVPEALYYSEIAMFAPQVERYLRTFPREQVHIVLYDDLAKSSEECYFSVLDFLGIRRVILDKYGIRNPYKAPRSTAFAGMVQRPPGIIRFFLDRLPPYVRRAMLEKTLMLLNTRRVARAPLRPEFRRRLSEQLAPGIRDLERLIDRDLSLWLKDGVDEDTRAHKSERRDAPSALPTESC
jgi:hypothetical protein